MGCGGGQVKTWAPGVSTDRDQTVLWAAQLHAYDRQAGAWVPWGTSGWAYAGSVNGRVGNSGVVGIPIWYNFGNNAGVIFRAWDGLPAGNYAVQTWLWTLDGGYFSAWAEYAPGLTYC